MRLTSVRLIELIPVSAAQLEADWRHQDWQSGCRGRVTDQPSYDRPPPVGQPTAITATGGSRWRGGTRDRGVVDEEG
ncbi:hypothetical protein BH20ACT8_BH20ACT8_10220 [soil metagenome]